MSGPPIYPIIAAFAAWGAVGFARTFFLQHQITKLRRRVMEMEIRESEIVVGKLLGQKKKLVDATLRIPSLFCMAQGPNACNGGVRCTLYDGHEGDHIAHRTGDMVVSRWRSNQ